MDDLQRAGVILDAVDATLDALRDKDDPDLETQIATLEEMRAELVRRLEHEPGVPGSNMSAPTYF